MLKVLSILFYCNIKLNENNHVYHLFCSALSVALSILFSGMKVLLSSEELDGFIHSGDEAKGLSDSVLSEICTMYGLDKRQVLKYRQFQ